MKSAHRNMNLVAVRMVVPPASDNVEWIFRMRDFGRSAFPKATTIIKSKNARVHRVHPEPVSQFE